MKKKISIVLAGLMMLAACGGNSGAATQAPTENGGGGNNGVATEKPTDVATAEPTPTPEPTPEPIDLGGYEFRIVDFADDRFIASAEAMGTPLGDAKMDAIENIEAALNCKIVVENIAPDAILNAVQPAVFSGEKYGDMIITTEWAYGRLLAAGLMTDLNTISTLDLSNPWWNPTITKATTLNGKVLGAAGIFNHEQHSWVVYFNKRIAAEIGLPDMYELVRTGEWTFDKMRDFCAKAIKDMDGDGNYNSPEDRYGLVTPRGDFERAMYLGMGGNYFLTDATGRLTVACATPSAYDIASFMQGFAQSPGILWNGNDAIEQLMPMFAEGNALFLAYMVGGPKGMKEMTDDWGMLPTPKRDAAQADYINVVDHNAPMFGVTITNRDSEKAGIVMEAMGKAFQKVNTLAREELEDIFFRSDDDADMMAYVENRGGYDLAFIMQQANNRFKTPMDLMFGYVFSGNQSDFAADMESIKEVLQYECDTFLGTVEDAN